MYIYKKDGDSTGHRLLSICLHVTQKLPVFTACHLSRPQTFSHHVTLKPTFTLAFELSGMHSLLILPKRWSMPMNTLKPLG